MVRFLHVTSLLLVLHVASTTACARYYGKLYDIQLNNSFVHPVHSEVH